MRILEVLHFFLPKHSAGTEVYTDGLARELKRRGHDVHLLFTEKVLSRSNYGLVHREHHGMPCHVVINNLLYESFRETYANEEVERVFARVLDDVAPDVVHFQHLMLLSLGLPRIARERGIATLMTLHDFWLYCARFGQLLEHGETVCRGPKPRRCADCMTDFKFRQTPLEKKVISAIRWTKEVAGFDLAPVVDTLRDTAGTTTRLLKMGRKKAGAKEAPRGDRREELFKAREAAVADMLPNIDQFLAPSRTVLDRMVSFGLPARRIRHVPLGVDLDVVAAPRPRGGAPVFGFIGTLAPHKGVHVLIGAMKYLKGHGRLLVFGRGDYYPRYAATLQTLAQRLPVEFKGSVPRQEIGRAFAQIDVLVMPSVWLENYPIVIQEARAARVPVIASDIGGMREAVRDGVDGLLFRAGDAAALARKMAALLREPGRIEELAAAAEAPATLEEHVDAIEERLARAVEARRDHARP